MASEQSAGAVQPQQKEEPSFLRKVREQQMLPDFPIPHLSTATRDSTRGTLNPLHRCLASAGCWMDALDDAHLRRCGARSGHFTKPRGR
eukprot:scaffold148079_cov35-Tisochrysis_lutea.AAC.1